ncbi:MAG: hypothetical protein A3F18_06490 [Legionellales bacterium RIFCSPHIGHO2_12_FULL_37_14]|nr:MAG: hypothetical protein A3F18_06490 [Legionellales bacterium RIFCSPHIGHO2_12_FULL_37_14]
MPVKSRLFVSQTKNVMHRELANLFALLKSIGLFSNYPLIIKTYIEIAEVYQKNNAYGKALHYYKLALRFQDKYLPNNPIQKVGLFSLLGDLYFLQKDKDLGLDCYLNALTLLRKYDPNKNNHIEYLLKIGRLYYNNNKMGKALLLFHEALQILTSCKNKQDFLYIAIAYDFLGKIYLAMHDFKHANYYFVKCLEIQTEFKLFAEIADTYDNFGDLALLENKLTAASINYNFALDIRKGLNLSSAFLAKSYHNLGKLCKANKEFEKAITNLNLALKFMNTSSAFSLELALTYRELADVYYALTQDKSQQSLLTRTHRLHFSYLKKVIFILNLIDPKGDLIIECFQEMGIYYKSYNLLQESLKNFLKAINYQEINMRDSPKLANNYEHIADIYVEQKRTSLALKYYIRAYDIKKIFVAENVTTVELKQLETKIHQQQANNSTKAYFI